LPDFLAALAMISPPNLSLRPMSIVAGGDTFDLNFEGTIGIGAGMIFLAPNVWQIFQGSVAGDPATAIVNADILFLEYLAANPNTILVGGLQSVYLFPNPPPPPTNSPQYIAVFRFAFRAR
jgi:hypothetical protein